MPKTSRWRKGRAEAVIAAELNRAPLTASSIATSAALISGGLRLSPFVVETSPSTWRGTVTFDLKTLMLDARGTLSARAAPPEWTGRSARQSGWHGTAPRAVPSREIDVGPFRNGLAAIVSKRELEKIEAFEKAEAERQRQLQAKQEADRLKAKAAADEAARQARIKEEADQARRDAERLQSEQQKQQAPEAPDPSPLRRCRRLTPARRS